MSFVPRPKKPPFPIRQRHKFSLSGRRGFASSARNTSLIHIFESKTELPVKACPTAVTTLFSCAEEQLVEIPDFGDMANNNFFFLFAN